VKRPWLDLDSIDPVRLEGMDIAPELEACLEATVPDRDPSVVYAWMRDALNELYHPQRQVLNESQGLTSRWLLHASVAAVYVPPSSRRCLATADW
jgi:hypothetical protein